MIDTEGAYNALRAYNPYAPLGIVDEEDMVDLVADLMHLCDKVKLKWGEIEAQATIHHHAEKYGETE